LAEALTVSGYHTVGIVANPWLRAHTGLGQGFAVYDDRNASKRAPATLLTAAAREWLDTAPREPFFLYLHLMDVHEPYDTPREDFDALRPFLDGGDLELSDAQYPPEFLEVEAPWATAEQRRQLAYWQTRYAAGVRLLDRRLAGLLGQLRESGALDRSWVVVTSDHGEELFEHGGWGHGENLYDHQLRVPLVIRPPGGLTAARRIEPTVRLIDLMPTILEIAGGRSRPELQGTDLGPLMRGESETSLEVFSTGVVGRPEAYALRVGRHKLVVDRRSGVTELFDVVADPGELTDLSSRMPERRLELDARLDAHLQSSIEGGVLEPLTTELPQAMEDDLRALGYVD
jgi:arylsulfatase A-like enzyme